MVNSSQVPEKDKGQSTDESKTNDKKKDLRILEILSRFYAADSNHLSLHCLCVAHSVTLSAGGGRAADYVRLIRNNVNFWILFPLTTRETRSLLLSNSSGEDFLFLKTLIILALKPKYPIDDPYVSDRVAASPHLAFYFPSTLSDKRTLNFFSNTLSAVFPQNDPLLPLATLRHKLLD